MTTQDLIKRLRSIMPLGPLTEEIHKAAADRLEELQRLNDSMQADRDLWIKVGREKLEAAEKERDEAFKTIKRLQSDVNTFAAANQNALADLALMIEQRDEARAEIERLRKRLTMQNNDACAEVERLTKEFAAANSEIEKLTKQNDEARAEVEKVKGEFIKLSTDYCLVLKGCSEGGKKLNQWAKECEFISAQLKTARAEVEERKDALLDSAKQIDELKKQRDIWLHKARQENEKYLNLCAEVERLKQERDLWQQIQRDEAVVKESFTSRPDPSRLEIAAMIYAGLGDHSIAEAITAADVFIAAAREGGK